MNNIIKIILLGLTLSACIPGVVKKRDDGSIVFDQRPIAQIKTDHDIRYNIHEAIVRDSKFRNSHIVVSSFNNTILLAGQTPHDTLRVQAEKVARDYPNVGRVYNEIRIGSPTSMLTRSSDIWITTKLKAKMLAAQGLTSSQIKVITENGTVFLIGEVNEAQAKQAVDIARRVDGVQRVVKVFQYQRMP